MEQQTQIASRSTPVIALAPISGTLLQRRCGCGESASLTGACSECRSRRFTGGALQPQLRISEPTDAFEREADGVADRMLGMSEPLSATPLVQRRLSGDAPPTGQWETAPQLNQVLFSAGEPLDEASRSFFAPRFGHDFSHVRVHTDADAAASARAVNALAYTVGRDIVFDTGRYDPMSFAGRRLLAHELTHVVQQGGASAPVAIQRQPNSEESRFRDLPIFLEKLELDVGKNLQDYGHHLYQAATLHPDEPDVLKEALGRYALGKNVLTTTFKFAGFKADTANKLAVGTGILFKSVTLIREGELTLDFQIDLGRGLKLETNLNLGVDPKDMTDVRKAGVNVGLVRRF